MFVIVLSETKLIYNVNEILLHVFLLDNLHCNAGVTEDYVKDDIWVKIEWPATIIGSRRIVRCPYAYVRPSYAHRDCVLSVTDHTPKWNDANVTLCPEPPFSRGVEQLAKFTVIS